MENTKLTVAELKDLNLEAMTKKELANIATRLITEKQEKAAKAAALRANRVKKPLTDEQKAKRYAYSKARRQKQSAELAELKARLAQLEANAVEMDEEQA